MRGSWWTWLSAVVAIILGLVFGWVAGYGGGARCSRGGYAPGDGRGCRPARAMCRRFDASNGRAPVNVLARATTLRAARTDSGAVLGEPG